MRLFTNAISVSVFGIVRVNNCMIIENSYNATRNVDSRSRLFRRWCYKPFPRLGKSLLLLPSVFAVCPVFCVVSGEDGRCRAVLISVERFRRRKIRGRVTRSINGILFWKLSTIESHRARRNTPDKWKGSIFVSIYPVITLRFRRFYSMLCNFARNRLARHFAKCLREIYYLIDMLIYFHT